MAARFAVTTGNWSGAIWAATVGGAAGSAAVPTTADDVTINISVVVTVDDENAVADLITAVNGTLQPSQTANSTLTLQRGIATGATTTSHLLYDMSAVPSYTAKLLLCANGSMKLGAGYQLSLQGDFLFKGAAKTATSYTKAALVGGTTKSVEIEDVTGWRVGDKIVFATTQAYVYNNYGGTHTCAWSGGYLTMTRSSGNNDAAIVPGLQVRLDQYSDNINASYVIYDVPSANTFRIAMPDPGTIVDYTGVLRSQPATDQVTIDSITPTTGAAGTVAWSDGTGATGSVFNNHTDKCIVGNFTRNVIVGPALRHNVMAIIPNPANRSSTCLFEHVMFNGVRLKNSYNYSLIGGGDWRGIIGMNHCSFYDIIGQTSPQAIWWPTNNTSAPMPRTGNIVYVDSNESTGASWCSGGNCPSDLGYDVNTTIFRARGGFQLTWPSARAINPRISGVVGNSGAMTVQTNDAVNPVIVGGAAWGNLAFVNVAQGGFSADFIISGMRLGIGDGYGVYDAKNGQEVANAGNHGMVFDSCIEHSGGFTTSTPSVATPKTRLFNRNGSALVQEVYLQTSITVPAIQRDSSSATYTYRGTSSMQFQWTATSNLIRSEALLFATKTGQPVTITGYFRKNSSYGASTLPYVEISGLGITPVRITATSASTDDWEKFEFLPGTATEVVQNSGGDANLLLTFAGQSAVNGAKCWFAGVPISPFVTRCRHYGYMFDETNPSRVVDPLQSASFTTADAYAEVDWTWGASASSAAIISSTTFQKLFDGHQAEAVQNVGSKVALTGAGAAGSPILFAAGNVTISDGAVLNGPGSISMSGYLLSTEFSSGYNYTYTGGAWSQLASTPSFSGGTLALSTVGSYTFTASSITIACNTTGTYNLGACSFAGQIVIDNPNNVAITVQAASGADVVAGTNPGNTTITIASNTLTVAATVTLAGAEVRVYDLDNTPAGSYGTELGGTESCPGATFDLAVGSGNTVLIQIIKDGYVEFVQSYAMGATATFTAVLELDTYS